jgi:ribosomal protein S18 acetylase RimI-like enzyme
VVVRRVLPGLTGPTGGPAMTDVLGVMESWDATSTTVRDASGAVTRIDLADIVSGKPVTPRRSVRLRVSPEDAEHRAMGAWPAPVTERLGAWRLRAGGGYSTRANSVLAAGDPGLPFATAVDRVLGFYASHGLPPCAQVVIGSEEQESFERAGWVSARPGEADSVFEITSVAAATRMARRLMPAEHPTVFVGTTAGRQWLADDDRALSYGVAAVEVLEGPEEVGFLALGDPAVAKARVALAAHGAEPWSGISNVWVHPAHRRQGLAIAVVTAALEWSAERGATTVFLQTRGDNPGALALYDRLGFIEHHRYRYLAPSP